jgi:WD40 repeat protein
MIGSSRSHCLTYISIFLCLVFVLTGSMPALSQGEPAPHYMYSISLDDAIGDIHEIALSPNGEEIALGGSGVFVYNFSDEIFLPMESHFNFGGPTSVAWNRDGTQLAGAAVRVVVWDAESGKIVRELAGEYRYRFYTDVTWDHIEDEIAVTSIGLEQKDWAVQIWNTTSFELLMRIQDNNSPQASSFGDRGFGQVQFIPPENLIITTSWGDMRVRGWDITTGQLMLTIEMDYVPQRVAISENTLQIVALAPKSNTISIYDLSSGEIASTIQTEKNVQNVSWSPTGDTLAILDDAYFYIWSDQNGLRSISEVLHPMDVNWSSDGKLIAVLANNNISVFGFE